MIPKHDTASAAPEDLQTLEQFIQFNARTPTGERSVRCLVCGEELQYITHSHVASHEASSPRTIGDYKRAVADTLDIDESEVPIVSPDLHDRLSEKTSDAWQDGKYEHFRMATKDD